MRSSLLLNDAVVESLTIKTDLHALAHRATDLAEASDPTIDLDVLRAGSERRFLVPMHIRVNHQRAEFESAGFSLDLKVLGYFSFDCETDEHDIVHLMTLNAPSILYGVARGIASQSLAMTAVGRYLLPSVNFVEIMRRKEQSAKRRRTRDAKDQPLADQDQAG